LQFEGHDTTSHGIMWTLYHFAMNPEIQKKAQAEVDSVFCNQIINLIYF